jgi:hypothetical protein
VRERRAARKARAVMVALLAAVVKLVMAAQIVIAMNVSRQVRLLGKERAARQRREEKFALPVQIS